LKSIHAAIESDDTKIEKIECACTNQNGEDNLLTGASLAPYDMAMPDHLQTYPDMTGKFGTMIKNGALHD